MVKKPTTTENIAFCPHCGNSAPQKLVYTHEYQGEIYDMEGNKSEEGFPCCYFVAICSTCNDLLVYHDWNEEIDAQNFSSADLSYPKETRLDLAVPDTVRLAYAEAFRIRTIAPNGYAVLLRRALEAVCQDRGVPDGVLQKRLAALVERGEIPATLAQMTSLLRNLGNAGAHHNSTQITVPMTWGMDSFFRAVVEYVYIAPRKIQDFNERLSRLGKKLT